MNKLEVGGSFSPDQKTEPPHQIYNGQREVNPMISDLTELIAPFATMGMEPREMQAALFITHGQVFEDVALDVICETVLIGRKTGLYRELKPEEIEDINSLAQQQETPEQLRDRVGTWLKLYNAVQTMGEGTQIPQTRMEWSKHVTKCEERAKKAGKSPGQIAGEYVNRYFEKHLTSKEALEVLNGHELYDFIKKKIRFILRKPEDTSDCTQAVYEKIAIRIKNGNFQGGEGGLKALLAKTAINTAIDYMRSRRRRTKEETIDNPTFWGNIPDNSSVEEQIIAPETLKTLDEIMSKLIDRQQQVIRTVLNNPETDQVILAEQLDMPVLTFYQLLRGARRRIRNIYFKQNNPKQKKPKATPTKLKAGNK